MSTTTAPVDERDPVDALDVGADGVELTCTSCAAGFVHSGRGRRPKRCPDCRASSSSSGSSASSSSAPREQAPKRAAGIATLKNNLHGQLTMLGAGLMFVDSFDGQVIITKAAKAADALANLAATNPSVRAGLEKGVELAGWGPVLLVVVEIALPILAHHGAIKGVPDPAKARPAPAGAGAGAGGIFPGGIPFGAPDGAPASDQI